MAMVVIGSAVLAAVLSAVVVARWFPGGGTMATADPASVRAVPPVIAGLPPLPALVASAATDVPILAWVSHSGSRLEPCGCVAGMNGGLVRRVSLLTRLPAERLVTLECGGWSGGTADYQRLRMQTYLSATAQYGCAALGLGAADVRLGVDTLRSLGGVAPAPTGSLAAKIPLVSANVTAADGQAFVRDRIEIHAGGRRLIITSVAPATASGDGLVVEDPAQALLRLIPSVQGASLVVLADLDEAGLVDLAKAVPGIAVVIGGDVQQPSQRPIAVGACRVLHVANEGKTLGWWPWGASDCAFELISDRVPDHPGVRSAIRAYQERLGGMNLAIDERITGLTTLDAGASSAHYVGAQVCATCHTQAATMQDHSRHAQSWQALNLKGYQRDPDCLRCHVTGLGLPDGYRRNADAEQMARTGAVSCESCHGRGSVHVSERSAGHATTGTLTPVTPATCTACHDPENSPRFAFDTYWERIRHGAH